MGLLASSYLLAQPLTPEQAVRQALERAEVTIDIEAGIDIARSELRSAGTWPNPKLSVERVTGSSSSVIDEDETTWILSQRFDLGGRRPLERQAARLGLAAAGLEAEAETERIRAEVLLHYYALLAEQARVGVRDAWTRQLDELARMAALGEEVGDLSAFESRRIAQNAALARVRLAEAETAEEAARLRSEIVPDARELTRIARLSFVEGELELAGLLATLDAEIEAVDRSLDLQHRARVAWIELQRLARPGPPMTGETP